MIRKIIITVALHGGLASVLCGAPQTVAPSPTPPMPGAAPQTRQTPPAARPAAAGPAPSPSRALPPSHALLDLLEHGVRIEPEPRLIVIMAALDAAGLDLTPAGAEPSVFRQIVRKNLTSLNPEIRERLQTFYQRHKLPQPATPADQAARYVSLAFALGPPPSFEAPTRSDDLPSGLLEVLDFAPLLRDFYRHSGIEPHLPEYLRMSRAEGDNLRRATGDVVRAILSYLQTRAVTTVVERVQPNASAQTGNSKNRKQERRVIHTREKDRRFVIVPDLLAAPATINFRVIGDDYFVIVPYNFDPLTSVELRRAYLQYVIDPLVLRFNKEVAARRLDLKALLDEQRARTKSDITPDVFLSVTRSLTAAADARMLEQARLSLLTNQVSRRLQNAKSDTERAAIPQESQATRALVEDATTTQLADAYERGAVLSFYFAEQLRGLETSGFDLVSFLPDMIASFDLARERRRPGEYLAARQRFTAARARLLEQQAQAARADENARQPDSARRAALIKGLSEVDELLRVKSYVEAEARLGALLQEYQSDPRIFFALGQAASLSAEDALDENLQAERLNRALAHYRMTVNSASSDTDAALIARANAAIERIRAFLEASKKP